MQNVYINSLATFLPNDPVSSDDIEKYLGDIDISSSLRERIIRINGIEKRYYALDENQEPTHLSEEMAEIACVDAIEQTQYDLSDVEHLSFGTTLGDMIVPSITHYILGRLGKRGMGPASIAPTTGVCLSSLFAMKNAELSIKTGEKRVALVGGVERPSVAMRAGHYHNEINNKQTLKRLNNDYSFVHAAFLRWMLSDGCGAAVISDKPNKDKPSLKIDWIEITSYANELPTCMYAGANVREDILVNDTWLAQSSISEAVEKGMVVLRQDPKLLGKHMVPYGYKELVRIINSGKLVPEEIKLLLPHLSSFAFKAEMLDFMKQGNIDLGEEKWFTNLATTGNSGSAAIYIMLEEAMSTGLIQPGDKVLLLVPESARFSYGFAQLTCV